MKAFAYTTIVVIIAWILSMPGLLFAGLSRPLKKNELKILETNIKSNPNNINSRKFLAEHHFMKKNWGNVIRVLSPMSKKLDEEHLFLLTESYLELTDVRGAASLIEILLSKKQLSTRRLLLVVKIYNLQASKAPTEVVKNERVKSSIQLLKDLQKSNPKNLNIYNLWLHTLETFIPHYQYDALVVLEKMKKAKVGLSAKHQSSMCKYNFLAGYNKQSLISCKEATQVDEDNPINWIYLGKTHLLAGQKERGRRMLSSVGEKYSHSEDALWATAKMYHENKDLNSAYSFYKKASQHKKSQARSFLGLAIVSFELKKYEEALVSFRKHCSMSKILHHEFRRASGLLKDRPSLQKSYRTAMHGCQK